MLVSIGILSYGNYMMNKRFFIAYRHTGEDILELEKRIRAVEVALATKDIKAYATLFDEDSFVKNQVSAGAIMETSFQKISAMDGLFVLVMSSEKSERQLIEVGYALALKKPVIVAKQKDASTYIDHLTNKSIEFSDIDDLAKKIQEMDL